MTTELNTAKAEKVNPEALSTDSTSGSQNAMDEVNALRIALQTTKDTEQKDGGCYELPNIAIAEATEVNGGRPPEFFRGVKLSVTESFISSSIMNAVDTGSSEDIQNALRAAADQNPDSARRILGSIRNQMESRYPLNSVRYVVGTDENSNGYARLTLSQRNSWGKSAGSTDVTIDSHGGRSASTRELAMSPPEPIKPELGLAIINGPRKIEEKPLPDLKPLLDQRTYEKTS